MLAINHACWVSIEMIQKICITNRRLQLSNNETTSTPPRRKSLQVLLIWYKAETNECWWLPHVNNHHRQSVTSTNFRGALLPVPKVGGEGNRHPAAPIPTPLASSICLHSLYGPIRDLMHRSQCPQHSGPVLSRPLSTLHVYTTVNCPRNLGHEISRLFSQAALWDMRA